LKEDKNVDVGNLYINSLINLGICYKNNSLFEKAGECYEKVLKLSPNEESALFNYGMCISCSLDALDRRVFFEVTKEQASKALKLFKKVCELNKENQMAEFQTKRMAILMDISEENIKKKIE
jgi:tetratricopeptide (TPR) repeat protein